MSPPSYDDLPPPPYVLGDVVPLYTKLAAALGSAPTDSYVASDGLNGSLTEPEKKTSVPVSGEIVARAPRATVGDGEALIIGDVPDRAPPSRTVLMTHTETYTNAAGEHSHVVAWVWLEDGRIYYGKRAAPGLYDGAGPSPTPSPASCVDGQVIPRMKEGYHKAPPAALGATVSRLAGRDSGPDLCARDPSSSLSSVGLDEHEIEMYERLVSHPHPNITQYYGVSTYDDEYITGIRVSPSKLTLKETLLDWPFMRLGRIERGVYAGIAHLHSQSIRHNSLSLSSVRINDNGDAIIADLRFATFIDPEADVDVPPVGGGLKGWLRRRRDPDCVAARKLMREARTLRLYAMGRFVYWKAWSAVQSVLGGLKASAADTHHPGRATRNPSLLVLDSSV
ncbi:hypothetical protein PENSPDRAFT_664181 [Peniophora sp. CONT]|nr:hypothetical protein PENSPDRAFT_664181 [Peniophora sp. CONT]